MQAMNCELSRQGQRRTKQFGQFKQWGNEAILRLGRHWRKGHLSETWQYDKTNPNLPWYHWTLLIGGHWLADLFSLNVRFPTLFSSWNEFIQPWVPDLFFHLQYIKEFMCYGWWQQLWQWQLHAYPRIIQSSMISAKTCSNLLRHGLFGKKQTGHRFQVAVSPLELWALTVLWKNQVKEKAAEGSFSFILLLS